jgi:hypothetical protein
MEMAMDVIQFIKNEAENIGEYSEDAIATAG